MIGDICVDIAPLIGPHYNRCYCMVQILGPLYRGNIMIGIYMGPRYDRGLRAIGVDMGHIVIGSTLV